ncbi:MAG: WD40-repeat-containing domain protein [Benniella sp.]|nr:MAG: WD40-repeat-containing domain protein [Benniella sp.]
MVLGGAFSSSREEFSLQKILELANSYLENAYKSTDPETILALCHDAETSLSQAEEVANITGDESMNGLIATLYNGLGELLDRQGLRDEAAAFRKKFGKQGGAPLATLGIPVSQHERGSGTVTIPRDIFPRNVDLPTVDFQPPGSDARLVDTPQLACCLGLLQADCESSDILDLSTRNWLHVTKNEPDERERLMTLAADVIRAFKRSGFKDAKAVTEIVYLAPVLERDEFRHLIKEFYSGLDRPGLLDVHQLKGLAHLVQGARSGYLDADDIVKILDLLGTRLRNTQQQSTNHFYQLMAAVSHVLDAMAGAEIKDLDREMIHEPLSSHLDELKGSSDPYLAYQAFYAYQALLRVLDDETVWQATLRRTGKVVQGMSGLASGVKGLEVDRLVEGLMHIRRGLIASELIEIIKNTYYEVTSLAESGQGFLECLKEGISISRNYAWYPALRGADALIQDGQFAEFRKLVCEVPCRCDTAFQFGVCQRLGEVAGSSKWDPEVRGGAVTFLGEMYRNDTSWGHEAAVKQWILNILMELSSQSGGGMQEAGSLLQELQHDGNDKKQAFYRSCLENGPGIHRLRVALPTMASPSLLDRVQERSDVERQIRQLRKQRLKERKNAMYIQPQAIPDIRAHDDARFSLMDKVEQFLDSEQKVFLLLGESGAGKSTFNQELERHLWEAYKRNGVIPLYINLPTIDEPEHDMITKQLRKAEFTEPQIHEMKLLRRFTLICDGYDENRQIHNLYTSNRLNQPGEWNAKMVISCRNDYIETDYRHRFQPGDHFSRLQLGLFQEAVITPFSMDQIQEYITQYVTMYRPLWGAEEYKKALDLIPGLKELVTNPFLMWLSLEVLPRMVDPGQDLSTTHITRVALYDQFIEHWFERGKKRLGEENVGPIARAAFESLADDGFTQNGIDYLKRLSVAIYKEQDGHPIVSYSPHNDKGSWKTKFFSRKDKQLLREACPLVQSGNQHQFIHRSLLEYGMSLAVFDPQVWKAPMVPELALAQRGSASSMMSCDDPKEEASATVQQEPDLKSPLTWMYLTKEPYVLQFLEERVHQEPLFKEQLLDYIERSKGHKKWRIAASNSITILLRSGMQFNRADLRGIRIPRADLSNGMFESAQLQLADLRYADLRGTWLRHADLSNTEMAGVRLGESPHLEQDNRVMQCVYSPDGKAIVVVFFNHKTQIFSTSTWEVLWTLDNDMSEIPLISPNGDELAVCSTNSTVVQLWDLETRECRLIAHGHGDEVLRVVYSSKGDRLASISRDRTLKLWDLKTGDCLNTLNIHSSDMRCVVLSPNNRQLASGGHDCIVRLWDMEADECIHILIGHEYAVQNVVYSPLGDYVASAARSHTCLWNVVSGDCCLRIYHDNPSSGPLAYSPKGNQFACAKNDLVQLWGAETRNRLHLLTGHTDSVEKLVYSSQGDLVASSSCDRTVRIWDTETGGCLRTLTCDPHSVEGIAFSPNGDRIITTSAGRTVQQWDIGIRISRRYSSGHNLRVHMVQCSPKGDQFASCSDDTTARLWDVETGSCRRILRGHSKGIRCIAYSPQGDQIATGSLDKTIRLWDVETGTCSLKFTGHDGEVFKIAYSLQGDRIASCSEQMGRVWETGSGNRLRIMRDASTTFSDILYSPTENQVAIVGRATVRMCDVTTGLESYFGPSGEAKAMYSREGDQIIYVASRGGVGLWDINARKWRHSPTKETTDSITSVAYSPHNNHMATGHSGGTVRLWNATTGAWRRTLNGHTSSVKTVVYSAQGNLVVSASDDKSVRLWNAVSGRSRGVIQGIHDRIKDIAWAKTPIGDYVVAGCDDGVVGAWQIITDRNQCQVRMHWRTANGDLDVKDTSVQDVQGLSSLNERILRQLGAVGEPADPSDTDQMEVAMSPEASGPEDTSDGSDVESMDIADDGEDLTPPTVLGKRPLELEEEEEHEDVAKRRCSSQRGSEREPTREGRCMLL